jgi:hypothetical protein
MASLCVPCSQDRRAIAVDDFESDLNFIGGSEGAGRFCGVYA